MADSVPHNSEANTFKAVFLPLVGLAHVAGQRVEGVALRYRAIRVDRHALRWSTPVAGVPEVCARPLRQRQALPLPALPPFAVRIAIRGAGARRGRQAQKIRKQLGDNEGSAFEGRSIPRKAEGHALADLPAARGTLRCLRRPAPRQMCLSGEHELRRAFRDRRLRPELHFGGNSRSVAMCPFAAAWRQAPFDLCSS